MKKYFVLFLVFVMAGGIAFAQDDLGLTVGLEVYSDDVLAEGDIPVNLVPFLQYDGSFLDGNLTLWARMKFDFGVAGYPDDKPVSLNRLEIKPWYHISLSDERTLSFGLWSYFRYYIYPDAGDEAPGLILKPMIKFNQNLGDAGDIYAQIDIPLGLVGHNKYGGSEGDVKMGLNPMLGWESVFGLGIEVTPYFVFLPDGVDTYDSLDIFFFYSTGPFYAELNVNLPNDFDAGVTISPYVELGIGNTNLTIYFGGDIFGVGGKDDVGFAPYVGVMYSF